MKVPRIYYDNQIDNQQHIILTADAYNHAIRVLRMHVGEKVDLFDGSNRVFHATITAIDKKQATVTINNNEEDNRESTLSLHLGQVVSRGEKMEFTIQKAVELGVKEITPLLSSRCGVKLDQQRWQKKLAQWQKIIISACEQCGRNKLPQLHRVITLEEWCTQDNNAYKLTLHPKAKQGIRQLTLPSNNLIQLLIGPEGGLSEDEVNMTTRYRFTKVALGPRILRTETAALTAITALQVCFGDLK